MTKILDLWIKNKEFFQEKNVQQIISLCGNGQLTDNGETSIEFRELLANVPSDYLQKFTEECLISAFQNSGLVLQDIINQVGYRLGFVVEWGLYKGKINKIGYDGIWSAKDEYKMVVEVKTTDSYRINLDTLANYRFKLIDEGKLIKDNSSILIVVGRQDTGDLEAQIRGSRHAWDIRLISADALLKLMFLKENLNDAKTIQQINEILKPLEYTRIDRIIDLIFSTSEDLKIESTEEDIDELDSNTEPNKKRVSPSNFTSECVEKIAWILETSLVKHGRCFYVSYDSTYHVVCIVSKRHTKNTTKYWFAFHLSQQEFLKKHPNSYVVLGCGSSERVLMVPFQEFLPLVTNMGTTESNNRLYHHVLIIEKENQLLLDQPKISKKIDITKYLINQKV